MADFGVGLASGVLIEVAKAIIEVVKVRPLPSSSYLRAKAPADSSQEVRENKKQCEVLAQRCLTISIAIKNVVDVNKASLAIHKHTYSAYVHLHVQRCPTLILHQPSLHSVKGHVEVFNSMLELLTVPRRVDMS